MPIPLETMLDKVSLDTRREIEARATAMIADNRIRIGEAGIDDAQPPRLAEAVFSRSLRDADRARVLLDLNHRFEDNIGRHGRKRANRLYWVDTIRAIGPLLMIRFARGIAPSWLSRHLGETPTERRP